MGIILKFHRTLLCPLITTKIERIPPFEKGGLGGIYEAIHLKNPPRSPFSKGGSIISIYGVIEFKKDTITSSILKKFTHCRKEQRSSED
jgi:hypothetical protein